MNVYEIFQSPPPRYRPKAIWVWNHTLEKDAILQRLRNFAEQGFKEIQIGTGLGLPERDRKEYLVPFLQLANPPAERNRYNANASKNPATSSKDTPESLIDACIREAERLGLSVQFLESAQRKPDAFLPPEITTESETNKTGMVWDHILAKAKQSVEYRLATGENSPPSFVILDSIAGFRKHAATTYPNLHTFQQPWWECQSLLNERLARLTGVLNWGEPLPGSLQDLPPGLIACARKTESGHLFFILNATETGIRNIHLSLPSEGTPLRGHPDTGVWTQLPIAEQDTAIDANEKENTEDDGPEETIPARPITEIAIDLQTWESVLILVTASPPEGWENSSTRVGELEARLELPDTFTAYVRDVAYLPLRNWTFEIGANPEGALLYRTSFQIGDMPAEAALIADSPCLHDQTETNGIEVFLNDTRIEGFGSSPYLDRKMSHASLEGLLCYGENCLTVIRKHPTSPTIAIESAWYLAGDFALKDCTQTVSEEEWVLVTPTPNMSLGSWTEQGYPFVDGPVIYRCTVSIPETFRNRDVELTFEDLAGCTKINVDGEHAGTVAWSPWTLKTPALAAPGPHTIEMEIFGTLNNLLTSNRRDSGLLDIVKLTAR